MVLQRGRAGKPSRGSWQSRERRGKKEKNDALSMKFFDRRDRMTTTCRSSYCAEVERGRDNSPAGSGVWVRW
ncbi:hypothetical protein L484_002300 [Morus notabilis]|uniref:Uncharacterized protein n=1 Tax=Morus notabilis TaxID=981085 RepID=W9RED8_9ROSA|nr:hypothetical protein L484_002300 [Morus notabilis]